MPTFSRRISAANRVAKIGTVKLIVVASASGSRVIAQKLRPIAKMPRIDRRMWSRCLSDTIDGQPRWLRQIRKQISGIAVSWR